MPYCFSFFFPNMSTKVLKIGFYQQMKRFLDTEPTKSRESQHRDTISNNWSPKPTFSWLEKCMLQAIYFNFALRESKITRVLQRIVDFNLKTKKLLEKIRRSKDFKRKRLNELVAHKTSLESILTKSALTKKATPKQSKHIFEDTINGNYYKHILSQLESPACSFGDEHRFMKHYEITALFEKTNSSNGNCSNSLEAQVRSLVDLIFGDCKKRSLFYYSSRSIEECNMYLARLDKSKTKTIQNTYGEASSSKSNYNSNNDPELDFDSRSDFGTYDFSASMETVGNAGTNNKYRHKYCSLKRSKFRALKSEKNLYARVIESTDLRPVPLQSFLGPKVI